jgi:hypothetical protein
VEEQADADDQPRWPRIHHSAVSVAAEAEPLELTVRVARPDLISRLLLVYRADADAPWRQAELQRTHSGYAVTLPAEQLTGSSLGYAIELETTDGKRRRGFASRTAPQLVQVLPGPDQARERALDERFGGRRSVFSSSGDYVDFGSSPATISDGSGVRAVSVRDRYYRIEGAYTFRPLQRVAQFSIRVGIVRGTSPVPLEQPEVPGQSDTERFDVGLNYGAPTVRVRLTEGFHADAELLTSVTEVGFSVGGGGAAIIGDPWGANLTLGFETIQVFGSRLYSQLTVPVGPRFYCAPAVEITDMPHADDAGVRLLTELGADLGHGFGLAVRGGYQARLFTEGGPAFGASVSYEF